VRANRIRTKRHGREQHWPVGSRRGSADDALTSRRRRDRADSTELGERGFRTDPVAVVAGGHEQLGGDVEPDPELGNQRSVRKEVVTHLGALDFVEARDNVIFLGPPGTGKTHLAIALGIRACQAGHRVACATAAQWVDRLSEAHNHARLHDELVTLGRIPLLIIDEVGYIPFEAEAANLFFQLVSSRYERASVIVTSNKPFGRWGEVFGDATVAAAMIDRLVRHAEVVSLKGDSYRLKDRDLGRVPNDDAA
jgi:DNA replication protein DnaC